jgi:hypothetical protein
MFNIFLTKSTKSLSQNQLLVRLTTRVVSIAIAPESDTSGDEIKCSAEKSPVVLKFDYREH